ncbi:MAG TPA: F0F1 ATP synthase subunit A [Dongiaceae bacterium]|nr:F0F1 ATP synthase subunit A [Dongiaceae bacterium]
MAEGHHSPLEQFEIKTLVPIHIGGVDISFTNASLVMVLVAVLITVFMLAGMRGRAVVPGRLQGSVEFFHDFVHGLIAENIGPDGKRYFPFVFTIFIFILFLNLIGLVPNGWSSLTFTVTSHIIVTFAMAMVVFLLATAVGFMKHGVHFLSFFVPKGVPAWLLPLMVPIEVMSYFIRPITLSVRLFANMVAGHVMLAVIGGFVASLGAATLFLGGIGGIIPLAAVIAIFALELLIACLQAYVFAVLTCIYLNDAIHMAH